MRLRHLMTATALACCAAASSAATTWTDWTASNANSAIGTLGSTTVRFSGPTYGPATQTAGGIDYWTSGTPDPYSVTGRPTGTDIIAIVGGPQTKFTLSFSQAVTNPYFAGLSLGQPGGYFVTYEFDATPTLISSGQGYWGGCGTCLTVSGNNLIGEEGHGVVQFMGSFTSISWTAPVGETWHGFQVGVNAIPEPETYALMLAGLAAVGFMARRRKG